MTGLSPSTKVTSFLKQSPNVCSAGSMQKTCEQRPHHHQKGRSHCQGSAAWVRMADGHWSLWVTRAQATCHIGFGALHRPFSGAPPQRVGLSGWGRGHALAGLPPLCRLLSSTAPWGIPLSLVYMQNKYRFFWKTSVHVNSRNIFVLSKFYVLMSILSHFWNTFWSLDLPCKAAVASSLLNEGEAV